VKILIVDDHPIIRESLHEIAGTLQDSVEVLEAPTAAQALALAERHPDLDLVLLDLLLPDQSDPFEALRAFREHHDAVPVVVFSAATDRETVQRAIDMGAMGYIPKTAGKPTLRHALQLVLDGDIYIPSEALGKYRPNDGAPLPGAADTGADALASLGLTPREREVLALMVRGLPDKRIASRCGIGLQTVKNHLVSIRRKLDVKSRTEVMYKLAKMNVGPDRLG